MKRIDLLAAYRAKQRARIVPLFTAAAIMLAGLGGLAGYGVYAYHQMESARAMVVNARKTEDMRTQLQKQVDKADEVLKLLKVELDRKQTSISADRRVLGSQMQAATLKHTSGAATLVAAAGYMPAQARWSMVEITPEQVRVEGFGLNARKIIQSVYELRKNGLDADLQRLTTRRRGGERLLFYRIAMRHLSMEDAAKEK